MNKDKNKRHLQNRNTNYNPIHKKQTITPSTKYKL
jgi:hypothetical protein